MASSSYGKLWSRSYILLALGNLMMATGFYFLIPTLPVYVVEVLKARTSDVGYVLAAYTVSALIIRPFTGIALDTWGRKWIYLISLLIFTLTILLYPMIASFGVLLILRFFHGFSWGATTTSGMTAVVDVIPPMKRGRGIGYFGISFTFAMAVAPVIALMVLASWGYYAMFHLAAAISMGGLILVLFVRYPPFQPPARKVKITWKRFIEPRAVPISIPYALFGAAYGGIISYITLFDKELGFSQAGAFFLILAGGITASRLFAGQIFDKYGPTYLMLGGFSVTLLGFYSLAMLTDLAGFLFSAGLIGLGAGILMPSLQTMVNNVVTVHRRGAANATLITAFDLGIGLGSLGLGYLSEWIGFDGMYLVCTGILVVALGFYFGYVKEFYMKYVNDVTLETNAK
ncbi:MAG: MFS transporter [Bacteroidetes bacterium]|nr:MAG: MFS transporter [Bacteroidota bacterium]